VPHLEGAASVGWYAGGKCGGGFWGVCGGCGGGVVVDDGCWMRMMIPNVLVVEQLYSDSLKQQLPRCSNGSIRSSAASNMLLA